MKRTIRSLAVACAVVGVTGITAATAQAESRLVAGGQTLVLLDTDLLRAAAGLTLTGADRVTIPGSLGAGSVAFDINSRTAGGSLLPTTFAYDPSTFPALGSFSGTIEHEGTVTFNDAVTVGNFSIGFDVARVGGDASGFFVESTTGVAAILFDVGLTGAAFDASNLEVSGNLLVSPEFASFLGDTALTGADVGDAKIEAVAVPTPAAIAPGMVLLGLIAFRRRAKSA